MTWREDRDALIAQTVAFVQSVTGKSVDFAQYPLPAPAAAEPDSPAPITVKSVTPAQQPKAHTPAAHTPAAHNPVAHEAAGAGSADPGKPGFSSLPPPTSGAFGPEPFTSIASQVGLQRDMQTEIRTRVASFRAHQERFRRERQEYFSATLARLRASIDETSPPDAK